MAACQPTLIDWVVHSQSAGAGREALNYLSAYLFRTALSNKRLISDQNGHITFGYIESQTGKSKTLVLDAINFLARVLQHVLPAGFHKIRYYGWLHPRARKRFLLVQTLLALPLILSEDNRRRPSSGFYGGNRRICTRRLRPSWAFFVLTS